MIIIGFRTKLTSRLVRMFAHSATGTLSLISTTRSLYTDRSMVTSPPTSVVPNSTAATSINVGILVVFDSIFIGIACNVSGTLFSSVLSSTSLSDPKPESTWCVFCILQFDVIYIFYSYTWRTFTSTSGYRSRSRIKSQTHSFVSKRIAHVEFLFS